MYYMLLLMPICLLAISSFCKAEDLRQLTAKDFEYRSEKDKQEANEVGLTPEMLFDSFQERYNVPKQPKFSVSNASDNSQHSDTDINTHDTTIGQNTATEIPKTDNGDVLTIEQAVMSDKTAQVKSLLTQSANPNAIVPGVGPVLYFACMTGNTEIIKALIEAGADVNATGNSGYTPLMMAAQNGRKDIVKMLLQAGADVTIPHQYNGQLSGLDAISMAENAGFTEIVELLKSAQTK